jgi:divalent anion:Na+ symporter, DASS family
MQTANPAVKNVTKESKRATWIRLLKLLVCALAPVLILLLPVPAGLTVDAWRLFAFYIAAIFGLMLRPLPESAVILLVIAALSLLYRNTSTVLAGYSSPIVWLVFTAFMIGTAIVETGLGRRIAYLLIGKMGNTTLGLGYVAALTDFLLSPVTPSNTARSGGHRLSDCSKSRDQSGLIPGRNRSPCWFVPHSPSVSD